MESRQVIHSWYIGVVSEAMVGWVGAGMDVVAGKRVGQRQGVVPF